MPYIKTNSNWDRRISATLQEHCPATKTYDGAKELFYSVKGLGYGIWGYKFYDKDEHFEVPPYDSRQIQKINDDKTLTETERKVMVMISILCYITDCS